MDEPLIRFCDVVIDPKRRELRRAGEPVSVQPKVFDLILYLAAHRDRAVSKDELQDRVWPGVIVTETALTRAIMKARRALGDNSDKQSVIRTVHARGYRFVAELLPEPQKEARHSTPGETAPRPGGRLAALSVAGGVALLALIAAAVLFLLRDEAQIGARLAVLPVEDRTGEAELAWASLGLMSYANRLLVEAVDSDTIGARRMMDASDALPSSPTDDDLQTVRRSLGASHLVQAVLERTGGGLQLSYRVFHERGAGPPTVLAGNSATRLAKDMADGIVTSLPGGGVRRQLRTVSTDDFVNEAYARGLSLALQGDAGRARDYFEVAVRQEPALFWPRYELALTMRDTGELDEARLLLASLIAEPQTQGDAQRRAAANNALAQIHWRQQNYEPAMLAYEQAIAASREDGDLRNEAIILVNLGILARVTGDFDAARRHLGESLSIHDRLEDEDVGAIYQSLGQVELGDGRVPLARDYFSRANEAFQANGNRRGAAAAQNALARVDHRLGRLLEAERHMLRALETREALDDFFGRVASRLSLAEILFDLEEPSRAGAHADDAIVLAEGAAYAAGLEEALEVRAWIALETADLPAAGIYLARLTSEFADSADSPRRRLLAAKWAAANGGIRDATNTLELLAANGPAISRIDALHALGAVNSDRSEALAYWNRALTMAEREHEGNRVARVLVARAERALADGDAAAAVADIRRLADEFPEWPALHRLQAGLARNTGSAE